MKQLINSAILMFALTAGSAWAAFEGFFNTFYGSSAGALTAGDNDEATFVGAFAGTSNTTGSHNSFIGRWAGYSNTTGPYNTFLGSSAGFNNTTGSYNTFLGYYAGQSNTNGPYNVFLGASAGASNGSGGYNIFLGGNAGFSNTSGYYNTILGHNAGYYNTIGNFNTFLGFSAGGQETASNRLYIANSSTTTPLIYGEFDTPLLKINGNLEVIGPNSGLVRLTDVTTNLTTKGARLVLNHYNNASLPVYLFGAASTPSQNFLAFGGGNVIGNAATQLDFFTAPTTTTAVGTSRMTINGNGNVGMGVSAPVYPLQMASGALVTAGGVWTNASSRALKEQIETLSSKDAQAALQELNPVTFQYLTEKGEKHVGFIAEDVPELVATPDRKGVSAMDVVAVLTKVVKEQQQLIAELKEQNNLMSERVSELERISPVKQTVARRN